MSTPQHTLNDTDLLVARRRALKAQLAGLEQARHGVLMELGTIARVLGDEQKAPTHPRRDTITRERVENSNKRGL